MEPIRPKTHRIFIWIVIAVLSLLVLALVAVSRMDFTSKIKGFEEAANKFFVQTFNADVLTPPPLRGVFGESTKPLTNGGVLEWTNKNREEAGAKDLTENTTLSKMALQKLDDLFAGQYFEHESPLGVGPSDLAKQAGYDYIVIGENLALGNFDGDKALVDAWMASPGHRANILNTRYSEIGIAVGQGVFEGKKTWLAVQEFGLPITACTQPSGTSKASIDKTKNDVAILEASLAAQKQVIDQAKAVGSADPKYAADYNVMVEKYNTSVHQFNAMVVVLKSKISDYNKQVATFNACAEVGSTTPVQI